MIAVSKTCLAMVLQKTYPLKPPLAPPVPAATCVRRLPRDSEAVRRPASVQHGRAPGVHRADLVLRRQASGRAARGPHHVLPCRPGGCDPARSGAPWPSRGPQGSLPRVRSASAPRRRPMAGLATLPARSPVTASCLPLPRATPDAGPVWVAGPSLSGTCTLQHSAGFSRRTQTLAAVACMPGGRPCLGKGDNPLSDHYGRRWHSPTTPTSGPPRLAPPAVPLH